MSTESVLLLILSGFIHTLWNGAFKTGRDRFCFLWWMILFSLVWFFPLFCYQYASQGISQRGFIFIGLSGICLSLYFLSLASAYTNTDFSLAYPISRGTSPLFVLLLASLILREKVSILGFAGILMVVTGLCIINLRLDKALLHAWREKGVLLALLTALFISTYRIVDKVGVGIVPPSIYYYVALSIVFCFVSLVIIVTKRQSALAVEWKAGKKKILFSGICLYLSYVIVLYVMTTNKISYVGAMTNFSIFFSILWGSLMLKEGRGLVKGIGALVVMLGIALIRFAG